VKELIKRKLGIDCRICERRKSGPVIIAKMENEKGNNEKERQIKRKQSIHRERLEF